MVTTLQIRAVQHDAGKSQGRVVLRWSALGRRGPKTGRPSGDPIWLKSGWLPFAISRGVYAERRNDPAQPVRPGPRGRAGHSHRPAPVALPLRHRRRTDRASAPASAVKARLGDGQWLPSSARGSMHERGPLQRSQDPPHRPQSAVHRHQVARRGRRSSWRRIRRLRNGRSRSSAAAQVG